MLHRISFISFETVSLKLDEKSLKGTKLQPLRSSHFVDVSDYDITANLAESASSLPNYNVLNVVAICNYGDFKKHLGLQEDYSGFKYNPSRKFLLAQQNRVFDGLPSCAVQLLIFINYTRLISSDFFSGKNNFLKKASRLFS